MCKRLCLLIAALILITSCASPVALEPASTATFAPPDGAESPTPNTTVVGSESISNSQVEATPTDVPEVTPTSVAEETPDLLFVEPDGRVTLHATGERLLIAELADWLSTRPTYCDTTVQWSPDGYRLALPDGVWTFGADVRDEPRHAPIAGEVFRWTRDGQHLAWYSWIGPALDEDEQPVGDDGIAIMVGAPDGDQARMLEGAHWSLPLIVEWSPAGDLLVAGSRRFEMMDEAERLPEEAGPNPAWSPSGDGVAWTVAEETESEVVERVMFWDGEQGRELARFALPRVDDGASMAAWATYAPPRLRWLPDGDTLLLPIPSEGIGDGGGTWSVSRDGTRRLVSPHLVCDLSPDGERMLVRTADDRILLLRVADGYPLEDLGPGWAVAWRPAPRGEPPSSPLAEKSPRLALTTPRAQGSAVEELQRRLAELGYQPGPVDGIFGPQTEEAVRSFQRLNGGSADGIVGPLTWAALRHPVPYRAR
jgi:hypothetical protein